jgi:hypothetical protein
VGFGQENVSFGDIRIRGRKYGELFDCFVSLPRVQCGTRAAQVRDHGAGGISRCSWRGSWIGARSANETRSQKQQGGTTEAQQVESVVREWFLFQTSLTARRIPAGFARERGNSASRPVLATPVVQNQLNCDSGSDDRRFTHHDPGIGRIEISQHKNSVRSWSGTQAKNKKSRGPCGSRGFSSCCPERTV